MLASNDHRVPVHCGVNTKGDAKQATGKANQETPLVTLIAQFCCPEAMQQHNADWSNGAFGGWPRDVAISL